MKNQYNKTMTACFTAYIVQAVVNNFAPLLFLTFQRTYGIPLSRITMLVTINFAIQLLVDILSVSFVDKIGYRASMVLAHLFGAVGLLALAVLPELFRDPLCHRGRSSGGPGKSGGGSVPFRSQGEGHEYAPLFLLLGSCRGGGSFYPVFPAFWN